MLWWIGAVLSLLISVAWAVGLSMAVSRGEKWIANKDIAPWYVFHGATGALAFWMILQVAE